VNIAFNLPLDSLYTYSVPKHLYDDAEVGKRVLAPLGRRNYTGVITAVTEKPSYTTNIKDIIKILDDFPIINDELMKFCRWISNYYLAPLGEVLAAAVPKGMEVSNKFVYAVNKDIDFKDVKLTELQNLIVSSLKDVQLTVKQLEKKLNKKGLYSAVNGLLKKGILTENEKTDSSKVKTKFENVVIFDMADEFNEISQELLYKFFKDNKIKSQKQVNAISYLIRKCLKEISVSELVSKSDSTIQAVNALKKKEIIRIVRREVIRETEIDFEDKPDEFELNKAQKDAVQELYKAIDEGIFKPYLLYGITGSGKTQIYIEAIKYILAKNKTAIVLVPEISLTPQLIQRFSHNFGEVVGVIHSRLSMGERYDVFRRIIRGDIKLVIGPRSALFAPFEELGIIIVDEEHDGSYKQAEMSPRYHARDSALMRARNNNAVIVLGSATPSLESFYNAKVGKYNLLVLPERAQKTKLPEVEIINMLAELKSASKFQKYENLDRRFLSLKLIYYMDLCVQMGQSIILLQNRRGYSSYLECLDCGYVK
jgi:primosomal protein N' (replication factor Y)